MDIQKLIAQMTEPGQNKAFEFSDSLAHIGGEEVVKKMIDLLKDDNLEVRYLASRTLGKCDDRDESLEALLEAINDKSNKSIQGDLAEYLDEYDCSDKFVPIFKLYLFGSLKTSAMAKEILDFEEFNITPRVIKKADKAWNHYQNNVKQDEAFELQKVEVEEFLGELKALFE